MPKTQKTQKTQKTPKKPRVYASDWKKYRVEIYGWMFHEGLRNWQIAERLASKGMIVSSEQVGARLHHWNWTRYGIPPPAPEPQQNQSTISDPNVSNKSTTATDSTSIHVFNTPGGGNFIHTAIAGFPGEAGYGGDSNPLDWSNSFTPLDMYDHNGLSTMQAVQAHNGMEGAES